MLDTMIARGSGRKRVKLVVAKRKYASIASKALRLAKKNARVMERKTTATSFGATVSNTGSVQLLTGIAEGTDYDDRVGKKITLRSVQLKGYATNNDSTANSPSLGRIMIVRDNTLSGSAPSITDVLLSSSVYSLRNPAPEKLKSYTVLYDKSFVIYREKPTVYYGKYKKLSNQAIFDGATVADVNKGALYVIMVSNRATSEPGFYYTSQVKYVDQ